MIAEEEQKEDLFYLMNEIDQKVASCKGKGILFVGMTKAGKSTSFNWISRAPLIGDREGGRGRKVCYKLDAETNGGTRARITGGFTSCTLVPNIINFENYNILDTAGYEDKRNYVGTIGVAYSLKAIFEVIKQVKFVIVLPETAVYSNLNELFSTFHNFLSMFKIDKISEQTKEKIFASTSLLFTRCERPEDIKSDIQNCLQELKNPSLDIKNKANISILLAHLLKTDKIAYFKMAVLGQNPQNPEVIQRLSQKEWHFFNIAEAKTTEPQPRTIVQLPFKPLYDRLQQSQKLMITQSISKRIKSYKDFCDILHEVIASNLIIQKINNTNLQHTQFIERITAFIEKNDHYVSQDYISKDKFETITVHPQKLEAVKLIIQLQDIILSEHFPQFQAFESIQSVFVKSMARFRIRFIKLSKLLVKMYSDSTQTALKLCRLEYILLRGIREFQMLYDISPYHVNDAYQGINDALQIVFPIKSDEILDNYIKSFKLDEGQKTNINIGQSHSLSKIEQYFLNKTEAAQFQSYFSDYHEKRPQPIVEFYPLMRQIKIVLAKTFFKEQNYQQAGKYLLQGFEFQCQYERRIIRLHRETYPNSSEPPADITEEFNEKMRNHYLSRVVILNSLKQCLIKTKKYDIAIQIADMNRDISSVCSIYRLLLQNVDLQLENKKQLLLKFADYCFNHGKWQLSCDLLEELFNNETASYERRMEINRKLVQYTLGQAASKEIYVNYLNGYEAIGVEVQVVPNLIAKIRQQLMI